MEGRTIIVGDVHGCARELDDLLAALEPRTSDRFVFVGDLVARGPDTKTVLARARELAAVAVLGNHEHRVIEARRALMAGKAAPRLGASHRALLDELEEADWQLLENMPLYLELDEHGVTVVHAGIEPGVEMSEQRLEVLTRMRSFNAAGEPCDRYRPASWAERYRGDVHIVFGHNARRGLQLCENATGLDTGCVYGGRLTALVLEPGEKPLEPRARAAQLTSVRAHAVYFSP